MRWFVLVMLALMSFVPAAHAAESDFAIELRGAQRMGWEVASVLAQAMASSDPKRFPGMHAWLKEYRAAGGVTGKVPPGAAVPRIDAERLVARNPAFWRAYFEIAAGDSGAMLLHAGLLLAAGEASRAAYVLLLARQNPDVTKEMHAAMNALLEQAQSVLLRAAQQVSEATKLHDDGAYAESATRLRSLLARWPANALAHYELALVLIAQQYVDAGRKPPSRARLGIHSELAPNAAATAAYARARQHDPLLIRAYSGTDRAGADALLTFGKIIRPLWETLARDTRAEMSDDNLNTLAGALHQVGPAELALVAFQVLVAREGGSYDEDDRKFVAATLRVLAPAAADAIVKRLGSARPEFARLVLP